MLRIFLHQGHVADIAATGNAAFEQIVAEHGLAWQARVQNGVAGADIEQALAGEAAGAEQILVHIRDRIVVGVDARLAREKPVEVRVFSVWRQRRDQARLQDSVAGDDAA